jgi:hypothetical protein
MKQVLFILIIVLCFGSLSCTKDEVNPEINYIKAKVNGVETIYKTLPPNADYYNYIRPGVINIRFNRDKTSSQYWSIDIYYSKVNQDINHIALPFTIKGPNPDFTGNSAEFHTQINDPDGGPYGKPIAGGSTFSNNFTLTITSVENNVVKGTFEGTGFGEFVEGEFAANLPNKEW